MKTYAMRFDGALLERGFWLYVWRITEGHRCVLYVGRTGDSSSPHAASPFRRIGQHLDAKPNAKGNALGRVPGSRRLRPQTLRHDPALRQAQPRRPGDRRRAGRRQRREPAHEQIIEILTAVQRIARFAERKLCARFLEARAAALTSEAGGQIIVAKRERLEADASALRLAATTLRARGAAWDR